MEGGPTGVWRDQDSEVYTRASPATVYVSRAALAQRRPASAFIMDWVSTISSPFNRELRMSMAVVTCDRSLGKIPDAPNFQPYGH